MPSKQKVAPPKAAKGEEQQDPVEQAERQQAEQALDAKVAGQAQGGYNIPARQVCPKHHTYMPHGFCKLCLNEKDESAKSSPNDRGMNAEEAAYVRRHRGEGKDPDEVLANFRKMKAQQAGEA